MKKILITGATGYIGRRLKNKLLARTDLALRVLVRNKNKLRPQVRDRLEVVEGDTFNQQALAQALRDIDVAFYLIHSMGANRDFEERDRRSAENFRRACVENGVKKIIYLGGLGEKSTASRHLLSRLETGEILAAEPDKIQVIWFRAGVIIGSGGASFEIIRNLVQKLPMMITPKWVRTKTQPIAVDDVLAYLAGAIDLEVAGKLVVDIGAEPMSFREMMLETARVMGLRRLLLPVPVLSPKLSSYWLILFTPVPFRMAAALVEGLKSETLVLNQNAASYFPDIQPMKFSEAVAIALDEMVRDQVLSRWCDSSAGEVCDIKDQDEPAGAILRDYREFPLRDIPPGRVFASICSLGGEAGWLQYNFLWRFRGFIDKLVGGYGLNRGRRHITRLRVGDALDFWKVVDIKENKRVLLLAQMKLPGKAWLEFDIREDKLAQTAHFYPRGVFGRVYWYALLPLHHLIFANLGKKVMERAGEMIEETKK